MKGDKMKKRSNTINTITGIDINEERTYDTFGNLIRLRSIKVDKEWKYNKQGHPIYHRDNKTGFECWREYDNRGNEILYKTSDGFKRQTFWKGDVVIQIKDNKGNNIKY